MLHERHPYLRRLSAARRGSETGLISVVVRVVSPRRCWPFLEHLRRHQLAFMAKHDASSMTIKWPGILARGYGRDMLRHDGERRRPAWCRSRPARMWRRIVHAAHFYYRSSCRIIALGRQPVMGLSLLYRNLCALGSRIAGCAKFIFQGDAIKAA